MRTDIIFNVIDYTRRCFPGHLYNTYITRRDNVITPIKTQLELLEIL